MNRKHASHPNSPTSKARLAQQRNTAENSKKLRIFTPTAEAVSAVHAGFSYDLIEVVADAYGHDVMDLAPYMGISPATLYRRKKTGQLSESESNRLYEYGHLFTLAVQVLGGAEEARTWMHRPALALGGERPIEYARTAPGLDAVKRLLMQLEEGVYV